VDFRSFCDNKGCGKEMRPVVDQETLTAYCTECGKTVSNISIFMRRQMVAHNQVRRNEKKKLAWAVTCPSCKKEGPPELDKKGEVLICSFCQEEITNLAKPFAQMIKVNLKAQRRADGG
jgi:DNA-directed RNA polymerase subunit RPC12/RpoP